MTYNTKNQKSRTEKYFDYIRKNKELDKGYYSKILKINNQVQTEETRQRYALHKQIVEKLRESKDIETIYNELIKNEEYKKYENFLYSWIKEDKRRVEKVKIEAEKERAMQEKIENMKRKKEEEKRRKNILHTDEKER